MPLKRYSTSVDGTIPVPALLYEDEVLLTSQEGVGIYDGPQKSIHHQAGTIHATTHRLFYVDAVHPFSRSFSFDLIHVARTEYYAGLFTSSSKVTLYLNPPPSKSQASGVTESNNQSSTPSTTPNAVQFWECEVCSNRNPIGLTSSASVVCSLCGVPRTSVKAPISFPPRPSPFASQSLSTSLPSSSLNLASSLNLGKLSLSSSPAPSPPTVSTESTSNEIACVACTFLNSPLLRDCEICGTPLPRKPSVPLPQAPHPPAKSAPASRSATPALEEEDSDDENDSVDKRMIRLSFRKGGDKPFYTVLRRSLLGKAWESKPMARPLTSSSKGIGISGILRSVENTAYASQTNMEDALEDLEALMIKWKDMVKLAQDLNERLTAVSAPAPSAATPGVPLALPSSSPSPSPAAGLSATAPVAMAANRQVVEPEEATFIRSSLAQLGLQMANAPVTQDMVRDERNWYEELAKELAGVLEGTGKSGEGMMRRRGIIALDEVWGGWNRARGVALLPPSTFLQVLPHIPTFTLPPIRMRTFPASGLSVLHTPPFGRAAFASRLVGLLTLVGPRTTIEVAQEEDLPIGLTQEMLDEVEMDDEICRDDGGVGVATFSEWLSTSGGGEVRYWVNIFRGYVWDGQE
ncbi:EAP30/Vps36 family-domain-containing protein [Ganoderma leucocontextum]|nr:EAP30/Vps36 family-domain-containing protein [Ganoderma leucocontextum]